MATAQFDADKFCTVMETVKDHCYNLIEQWRERLEFSKEERISIIIGHYANRRFFKKTLTRDQAKKLADSLEWYRVNYDEIDKAESKIISLKSLYDKFDNIHTLASKAAMASVDGIITVSSEEYYQIDHFYMDATQEENENDDDS